MLTAETLPFLLRLLEAPRLHYSALALLEYDRPLGHQLIDGGFLKPAFSEGAVSSDGLDLTSLELIGRDRGSARYFDPQEGIVEIDPASTLIYRIDFDYVMRAIFPEIVHLRAGPIDLGSGLIWDVGTFIAGKSARVELWFARRLGNPSTAEALETALRKRPSETFRLVLSSTPSVQIRDQFEGARQISVADLVNPRTPGQIDMVALKERVKGTVRATAGQRVTLSLDQSVLTIDRRAMVFRGRKLRVIVAALYRAHQDGAWIKASDLLDKASSAAHSLDQAFGERWREISPYLENQNGLWRINPDKTVD